LSAYTKNIKVQVLAYSKGLNIAICYDNGKRINIEEHGVLVATEIGSTPMNVPPAQLANTAVMANSLLPLLVFSLGVTGIQY
jgi:hypothetical protein